MSGGWGAGGGGGGGAGGGGEGGGGGTKPKGPAGGCGVLGVLKMPPGVAGDGDCDVGRDRENLQKNMKTEGHDSPKRMRDHMANVFPFP